MKLNGGNLTITSLRKEDHGRYECQAENEVKTIVRGTDLIIQSMFILILYHIDFKLKQKQITCITHTNSFSQTYI